MPTKLAKMTLRQLDEWRVALYGVLQEHLWLSALERVQRHFRQKACQVVIFHSEKGVEAGIRLVISRQHLADSSTEPWARLLEEALLVA